MKTFHRIASVLAAVALAVSLTAAPSLAEEGGPASPAPESTAAPAPDSSGSAYLIAQTATDTAGGEISAIERDDRFNLVLRVADYGAYKNYITADQISARVNSSVFTFTGNAEVGQLYEETDPNGAPYYSYVLLFRDVIYNGGGNTLSINLSYLNSTLEMQQLTVTLGQCVDEDPSTPNLMIRESGYGSQAIVAGTPFDLSLTVYATAGEESLNDVVVSLALPDGITMTSGSLTNYIGAMSPKSTRNVVFNLTPSAGFTGGVANITVSLVGTGADTNAAVSGMSTTISVPISQPDRFELGQLEVPDTIYAGDSVSVTLNFVNKGKTSIDNLEATISGTNLGADLTQQYLGNMGPGTENSVDFDLMPLDPGPMEGVITLTYEDANGLNKTVTKEFSATVQEVPVYDDMIIDDSMMEAPEQKSGLPVWGWILIAAGVLVVILIVVRVVLKKKKAAALARLEDSDDEDL